MGGKASRSWLPGCGLPGHRVAELKAHWIKRGGPALHRDPSRSVVP